MARVGESIFCKSPQKREIGVLVFEMPSNEFLTVGSQQGHRGNAAVFTRYGVDVNEPRIRRSMEGAVRIGLARRSLDAVVGKCRVRNRERRLPLHVTGGTGVRRLLGEPLLQIQSATLLRMALQALAAKIFPRLLWWRGLVRVVTILAAQLPTTLAVTHA